MGGRGSQVASPSWTEHRGKQPSPHGCWHSLTLNCAYRSPETRPSSGMCRLCSESSSHSLLQREEKARPRERRHPKQRLSGASPVLLSLLKRGALVWPCCMASHGPGSHPLTHRERPCLSLRSLAASCQRHTETGLYFSYWRLLELGGTWGKSQNEL